LPPTVIPRAQTTIAGVRVNYWNVIPPSLHKAGRRPKTLHLFNTLHSTAQSHSTVEANGTNHAQNDEAPPVHFFQPRITDQDDKMFFGETLPDFTATENTLEEDETPDNHSDWSMFSITAFSPEIGDM
jgi:hypothetical protein